MRNPLLDTVLECLEAHPEGLSEHALICLLESDQGVEFVDHRRDSLGLFQAHFMVMNALYQLQAALVDQGRWLEISPLKLALTSPPASQEGGMPALAGESALRDYYLDWANLEQTTHQDVDALLGGFWQRYFAFDRQAEALACLGLEEGAEWSEIQRSYRLLVAQHHPDKGGDKGRFIEVREAYEQLRRVRGG